MKKLISFWRLLAFTLLVSINTRAQLRFAPLSFEAKQPKLSLVGASNDVVIQSSINLTNWTFLYAGSPSNGAASFLDPRGATNGFVFYRAFTTNTSVPISRTISPKADTNTMVTSLMGIQGGTLEIILDHGGDLLLTFPSNVVVNPAFVTMTALTNSTGLPFASGMLAGVKIEPTNLVLFGAATLEITFPTNAAVDRRHVVSFMSRNDGTQFALNPDRVGSKSATIPVTSAGSYGSALASADELQKFAPPGFAAKNRSSGSGRFTARSTPDDMFSGFLAASVHCFTERVLSAIETGEQLNAELIGITETLEFLRAEARQGQDEGATDDPLPVAAVGAEACTFYNERIRPLFPAVQNNCSLLRVLAGITLGLSRQLQLLGYEDCSSLLTLADLPICAGASACFDEIKQCCQQDSQNRLQYRQDLVSVIRQEELLGVEGQPGCFDLGDDIVQNLLQQCTDVSWDGWASITENGNVTDHTAVSTRFHDLSIDYSGFVSDASEDPFLGISLTLKGNLSSSDKNTHIVPEPCTRDCGAEIGIQERSAEGEATDSVRVTIDKDSGTYDLSIGGVSLPGVQISRGVNISCSDCLQIRSPMTVMPIDFGPSPGSLIDYKGTLTDTNRFSGSVTQKNSFDPAGQSTTTFRWSFFRKTAP